MIDLMCWAAPRPSLPVTTSDEIRYHGVNPPARMTTGSRQPMGWGVSSRADVSARSGAGVGDQSVERRSSGALSVLAASDFTGSAFTGSSLALSTAGVSTRDV